MGALDANVCGVLHAGRVLQTPCGLIDLTDDDSGPEAPQGSKRGVAAVSTEAVDLVSDSDSESESDSRDEGFWGVRSDDSPTPTQGPQGLTVHQQAHVDAIATKLKNGSKVILDASCSGSGTAHTGSVIVSQFQRSSKLAQVFVVAKNTLVCKEL